MPLVGCQVSLVARVAKNEGSRHYLGESVVSASFYTS